MKREQAIERLALEMLKALSEKERAEQLDVMRMEDWSGSEGWSLLSREIQIELDEGELKNTPSSENYNQVLMMWLINSLKSVTNEFLCTSLNVKSIEGESIKLIACPCCGSCTIEERNHYDICNVCWWEDDGQDNETSDKIYGGPNYGISLTQGRYNFLKFGIYDPERKDLMEIKDPISKYERGREFEIIGEFVVEKGKNWKGKIIRTSTNR